MRKTAVATASLLVIGAWLAGPAAQASTLTAFTPGDVVVSVEGNGAGGGSYGDNQAAPLSLYEFATDGRTASLAGSLTLPQSNAGRNFAVSGEYGSSSEGSLQLSGNGAYLTVMGYGVSAAAFNANPGAYSPTAGNTALGQSGSMTNQSSYTPVPRVVARIGADGTVDSSTAVYNVFNGNNPRSVYSADGKSFYISGQGTKGDATGGVFYTTLGSNKATPVTGNDAGKGAAQDTRFVTVANNQLYISTDSKSGSTSRSFVGTLGGPGSLPTGEANGGNGPAMLPGFGNSGGTGKLTITAASYNGIAPIGSQVNLSPENFFFANATTLYVADSGSPKQTSASSGLGDGGLQKWSLVNGVWMLDYTLSAGLNLVANTADAGTTGLLALTGREVTIDGVTMEQIFATNYTIGDLDQTYLYGITDILAATSRPEGERFVELAAAPADSTFKGVAFAPTAVPEPASAALLTGGLVWLGLLRRRRRSA